MKITMVRIFLASTLILFAYNCKSADYRAMNNYANVLIQEAEILVKEKKLDEAAKIAMILMSLHPEDTRIQAIIDKLDPEQKEMISGNTWLGNNKAQRAKANPSVGERILWYLPDRILDFLDMFTLEVSFGPQLGVGIWVTRAVQAVAYVGATAGVGVYNKARIAVRSESSVDFAIGPVGLTALYGIKVGLGGIYTTARGILFHKPSHPLYQEYRDYWAIGAKLGVGIVGVEVEYHPVEIFDFLAGIILHDPLTDDMATTNRLKFTDAQDRNIDGLTHEINKAGQEGLLEYKRQFPNLSGTKDATPTEKTKEIDTKIKKK